MLYLFQLYKIIKLWKKKGRCGDLFLDFSGCYLTSGSVNYRINTLNTVKRSNVFYKLIAVNFNTCIDHTWALQRFSQTFLAWCSRLLLEQLHQLWTKAPRLPILLRLRNPKTIAASKLKYELEWINCEHRNCFWFTNLGPISTCPSVTTPNETVAGTMPIIILLATFCSYPINWMLLATAISSTKIFLLRTSAQLSKISALMFAVPSLDNLIANPGANCNSLSKIFQWSASDDIPEPQNCCAPFSPGFHNTFLLQALNVLIRPARSLHSKESIFQLIQIMLPKKKQIVKLQRSNLRMVSPKQVPYGLCLLPTRIFKIWVNVG